MTQGTGALHQLAKVVRCRASAQELPMQNRTAWYDYCRLESHKYFWDVCGRELDTLQFVELVRGNRMMPHRHIR